MLPTTKTRSLISKRSVSNKLSLSVKTPIKTYYQRPAVLIAEEMAVDEAPPFADSPQSPDFDQGWAEYQAATAKMKDLEALSAQLLLNLEELNAVSDSFDGSSLHMKASPSSLESLEVAEARRLKRAAAREARKQREQTVSQDSLTSSKASLESLMLKDSASEAPTASSSITVDAPSITTPKPLFLATGPSLAKGPSLSLPALASEVDGTIASASSSAREANARRARMGSGRNSSSSSNSTTFATAPSASRRRGQPAIASSSTQFFKGAGHDLLSASSEIDLTLIVKDLLFLEQVKKNLKAILRRDPTVDEWSKAVCMDEASFILRHSAGQEAKAKMVQSNFRLVISICSKYANKGNGMSNQDLITEGIQGLLKGVEKFDPTKGFKFSTYAHWWIRQAVNRAINEQSRSVRIPGHLYDNYKKVQAAKADLLAELGREATMPEISKRSGLSPKHIVQVAHLALSSVSLDAPLSDDSSASTRGDQIEDTLHSATAEEVLEEELLKKDLHLMLEELDEKEAGILKLRFGLVDSQEISLKEIGDKYSLTRERIRQIEAKAVRKLRQRHATSGVSVLNDYVASSSSELVARRSNGTNKT